MAFGVALSWMWAWGDFLWAQEPVYDIVIRGGRIVDGTGNPWFEGDVGIQGERIMAVGSISSGARRVIDAEGLVVAPGFIDLHGIVTLIVLGRKGRMDSLSGGRTRTFPYIECVFSKSFERESIA